MSLTVVGSYPLGSINLAASGAVGVLAPVLSQLDALLFGPIGLGSLQSELSAQLNGALQSQLALSASIADPLSIIRNTLANVASIQASLTAALSLPVPSSNLGLQLSASASVSAALAVKVGGLQNLLSAAINAKVPAADFIAALAANLSAGPVVVASWGYATSPGSLHQAGLDINAAFTTGVGGILPTDTVYGVLLVTKQPSASAAIAATMKVI